MKRVEVKWLDGAWRSFGTTRPHGSAGIALMVDMVNDDLAPAVKPGEHVAWRVVGNKFVVEVTDKPTSKLSKSDQD